MKLKNNSAKEMSRINDNVIPILGQNKDFRHEATFIGPKRLEAAANSCGDSKGDAEAHSRASYSNVLKTWTNVVEGTPRVKTFDLVGSTIHPVADLSKVA